MNTRLSQACYSAAEEVVEQVNCVHGPMGKQVRIVHVQEIIARHIREAVHGTHCPGCCRFMVDPADQDGERIPCEGIIREHPQVAEASEADSGYRKAAEAEVAKLREKKVEKWMFDALENMGLGTSTTRSFYVVRMAEAHEACAAREQLAKHAPPTEALVEALKELSHAASRFAEAVRRDTGMAYPWPAMDNAEFHVNMILTEYADWKLKEQGE